MALLVSTQITGTLGVTGHVTAPAFSGSIAGTSTSASYASSASIAILATNATNATSASYATNGILAGTNNYFPFYANNGLVPSSSLYQSASSIGVGLTSPTAKLHLQSGSLVAGTAPLKLASGTPMALGEAGAIEFSNDDYYATITTGLTPSGYATDDPPAFNSTYVVGNYNPADAQRLANPSTSPIGSYSGNSWPSPGPTSNVRWHIDVGTAVAVKRVYYVNGHTSGDREGWGARHFTMWGSNNAGAFADTTYGTDTNWTQLTTAISEFAQHVHADVEDPQYFLVTNSTAYKYYAIKIADNWGDNSLLMRRLQLQVEVFNASDRKGVILNDGTSLTTGRIPFVTTNGRLTDSASMTFNSASGTLYVTASTAISASYAPAAAPSMYSTYADAPTSSLNWITASFATVFQTSSLAVAGVYSFTSSNHPAVGQYADTAVYITNTIVAATASLSFPATWINLNGGWPTSLTASKTALLNLRAIDTSTVIGTWAQQP